METERGAAKFLLLDRLSLLRSSSVVFGLSEAERCLERLQAPGSRAGVHNEAQRLLGRTRAELEYRSLSDFVADLPGEMERLQRLRPGDRRDQQALLRRRRSNRLARNEGMNMQLRIAQTTGFEYDGKANTSFNEARLTPLTLPGQIIVHSRVEVSPTPWAYTYKDYWGSRVTAFEVLDPPSVADRDRLGHRAHQS